MCLCCVHFQACPRLPVLATAPKKQTETASASLHAWNLARPHHARLLGCADACEFNNSLQSMSSLLSPLYVLHLDLLFGMFSFTIKGCVLQSNSSLAEINDLSLDSGFKLLSLKELEHCVNRNNKNVQKAPYIRI